MARKKSKAYVYFLVLIIILLPLFFLSKLSIFEKNPPQILVPGILYSNLKNPISIRVKDDENSLKSVEILLFKDNNETPKLIASEKISNLKDINLQIPLPKPSYKEKINSLTLEIIAKDSSFWNFFMGNEARKKVVILVDDTAPKISILSNSYQIEQGGAAAVVFKVSDTNLKEVFIRTNKGKIFKATPYVKDGYYASLVAWDAKEEFFRAYVEAFDSAGNFSKENIRFYFKNRKYRVSNIKLSDKFLDGKIEFLADKYAPKNENLSRYEKFKFVNETLRASNEQIIHELASNVLEDKIDDFNLNLFLPLKNAMKVADYADHRFYSYNDKFISESYHMGLDLASVANANIISNNDGKVVFARENGIYGLNLMLYHGFGLYSLYGHCSVKNVDENESVAKQSIIAKTGASGLALGDHLHFEILVQGVSVRPEQWQDKKWIENNIYQVLKEGKKMILGQNL